MMSHIPTITVTMGDPAGVGPELCLRLAAEASIIRLAKLAIVGNARILEIVGKKTGLEMLPLVVAWQEWFNDGNRPSDDPPAVIVDCGGIGDALDGLGPGVEIVPGRIAAACGRAAYTYIENAIRAAMSGRADAVVTSPIHKEALSAAGVPFPGHTEILAAKTGTQNYCMMLTAEEITVSLVTTHVGLADVAEQLNAPRILDVIRLTNDAMQRIRRRRPRLTVCGLNPHAGEHGLFGTGEEENIIAPAIEAARAEGIEIVGPLAPDTAFLPSRRKETDAYVCMYHDQGLIPLKMLAFDSGVNVTLGLPIIRTSVDHGTAFDIAWTGRASAASLCEAVRLAVRLAENNRVEFL